MTKVGFIGLGLIGKPMCMNLVKKGFDVTCWNRTASKMEDVVAAGAKPAGSAREAAEGNEFTVTMVNDSPDVEEVILGGERRHGGGQSRIGGHRHEHDIANGYEGTRVQAGREGCPHAGRPGERRHNRGGERHAFHHGWRGGRGAGTEPARIGGDGHSNHSLRREWDGAGDEAGKQHHGVRPRLRR